MSDKSNGVNKSKPVHRRSRRGCRNCKRLKVKCDEGKPSCKACVKNGVNCDYSLVLTWGRQSASMGEQPSASTAKTGGTTLSVTPAPEYSTAIATNADSGKTLTNQEVLRKISSTFQNLFVPSPQQRPTDTQSFIYEYSNTPLKKAKRKPRAKAALQAGVTQAELVPQPMHVPESSSQSIIPSDATEQSARNEQLDFEDILDRFDEYDFWQPREFIDDFIITEQTYNPHSYKTALMQNPLRNALLQSKIHSTLLAPSPNHSSSGSDTSDGELDTSTAASTIPIAPLALPDLLIQVPVYRELYHHFMNVTADSLVPVPRIYYNNPFKTILPRMAMNTPHLLSLIVAYAATHRARCLNIPEPVEVINRLLERTFESLTAALENETEAQSDTTLATAIMLCSYSIVTSTNEDSWKTHLHGAREIVIARGIANSISGGLLDNSSEVYLENQNSLFPNTHTNAAQSFDHNAMTYGPQPLRMFNKRLSTSSDISFLLRMFAYIDVIGALSSSDASPFLSHAGQASQLWTIPSWNNSYSGSIVDDNLNVDFLLGFDLTMIPVLSKVSSLARRRRELDIFPESLGNPEYITGDENLVAEAVELSKILTSCCESGEIRRKQHIRRQNFQNPQENKYMLQLAAMNLAFGYSGLIHLYRRVLRFQTNSVPVQELVITITRLLDENIPPGNSIEACLSFPIFTVACEVLDPHERLKYRQRMAGMQRFGFGQMVRALEIVEECWRRNVSWTDIIEERGWSLVLA